MTEPLTYIEFYSGIGGFHYAMNAVNIESKNLAAFDINTTVNRIYKQNFPETRVCENNLTGLTVETLNKYGAKLWLLSPPCQPFTKKGLRLDLVDERSKSFLTLLKIFSEITCPPDYIFLENVVGFEVSDVFQHFQSAIEARGYSWKCVTLNSLELGIPNSRPRCYVMAALKKHNVDFENIDRDIAEAKQTNVPRQLNEYLDDTVDFEKNPELFLKAELISKFGASMSLVKSDSLKTTCFTKAYGRYKTGCGSYLCYAPELISETGHLCPEWKEIIPESQWNQLVRIFSPAEIASLLGFPKTFMQPPGITDEQMNKSLGNSLNVTTVSFLLNKLLIR